MFRCAFALLLLLGAAFLVGCGSGGVSDEDRVPEGAADTSDPTAVNMGSVAPGAANKAAPGPPGN